MVNLTRRKLLCGLSLSAGAGVLSVAGREQRLSATEPDSNAARSVREGGFDPTVDGFGFDNYSTPPAPPEPTEFVSEETIREYLTRYWGSRLQNRLTAEPIGGVEPPIQSLAGELYANANRLFGTRGYCFGIAMAAQWYFEEPTAIPVDRDPVSEIGDVDEPVDDRSSSPVRDDVERFHRSQFLHPEAWTGRWMLLRPELIDYRAQARELRAAIDAFGTVGVTISGSDVLDGHYLLLYDYEVGEDVIAFVAYDPNDDAEKHAERDHPHRIGIDTDSGEPIMASYEEEYDRFLFNDVDRTIRLQTQPDRR
jgi:hypothetical protein